MGLVHSSGGLDDLVMKEWKGRMDLCLIWMGTGQREKICTRWEKLHILLASRLAF